MKRFFISILTVSVFFLGLGALVEKTTAKFKSDEKALELIRKARIAIGGDTAIANVQSMLIVGRTSQKMKINGVESLHEGETEIAMQLPDKLMKMVKIGKDDGTGEAHKIMNKQVDVVVVGNAKDKMSVTVNDEGQGVGSGTGSGIKHKIVIKKDDGTVQELTGEEAAKWVQEHPGQGERTIVLKKDGSNARNSDSGGTATFTSKDGKTYSIEAHDVKMRQGGMGDHGPMKQNEILRTTLSLLLTAPQGMDVEYTYAGDGEVDGTNCSIVNAAFGGQTFKLYLDRSSNLPVAISYKGMPTAKAVMFHKEAAPPVEGGKDVVFYRKQDNRADLVDIQVKFSDYRAVNGVQLPFKWTQTDETFDVTSYEINPANIGEKFQNQKVMVRTMKPDGN